MKDDFGDRMKLYEGMEAGKRLMPLIPAFARIDGRAFHSFTAGMNRPYDKRLSDLLIETTAWLVRETNANMGYTQSDEITLTWYSPDTVSQIFFDGRIHKMVSILACSTGMYFSQQMPKYFEGEDRVKYMSRFPQFDCRVWSVPTTVEGANVFLWREQDATKNSISMAARSMFSHNQLENKNGSEMQEMMWQKGTNWNDYPSFFKRGTFIQKRIVSRKFTTEELEKLPEKHEARRNPDLVIERTAYLRLEMPPFGKVTNRPQVIYEGAEPIVATD